MAAFINGCGGGGFGDPAGGPIDHPDLAPHPGRSDGRHPRRWAAPGEPAGPGKQAAHVIGLVGSPWRAGRTGQAGSARDRAGRAASPQAHRLPLREPVSRYGRLYSGSHAAMPLCGMLAGARSCPWGGGSNFITLWLARLRRSGSLDHRSHQRRRPLIRR